jgi:4-amino-4-deoxy-L-arabinose transferase-like glycosyltransferase
MKKVGIQARLLIFTAGLIAFVWLLLITTYGLGASPDSTVYIETADNLMAGKGFHANGEPLTHYPPLYPLLLAIAKSAVPDSLLAARWLHALLFAINVMLVATAAHIFTNQHSLLAVSCTIILFLASTPVLVTHTMTWSESPFIMFSLAGLILLSLYVSKPRLSLLLLSSLMFGFAAATRYIGLVLLFPLLFGLLILNQKPFGERRRHAFLAIVVALAPIGLWFLRNTFAAKSATNRSFALHLVEWRHFADLVNTLADFVLLPLPTPFWINTALVILILVFFAAILKQFYRAYPSEKDVRLASVAFVSLNLVYLLSYIVFLLVSISFFDADTPLDSRVLLPVFISLILITVLVVSSLVSKWPQPIIRLTLFFFFSLTVILNGVHTVWQARYIQQYGLGYTSQMWQTSATINAIASLKDNVKLYSNGADAIQFLTEKESDKLPLLFFASTLIPNEEFEAQVEKICREVRQTNTIIVYFYSIHRPQYPTPEKLVSQCDDVPIHELEDGMILGTGFNGR